MDKTLMILGLGGVGTHAAHLAAHLPGLRVVVGDLRADYARQVAASLVSEAFFLQDYRHFPKVEAFGVDMLDCEDLGEKISMYKPDLIFNATTLLSWWHLHKLPHRIARRIYYGFPEGTGLRPWAPGHGTLLANLMKVAKAHFPNTRVVNVSGPDYLHEFLGKNGLAPDVGVGNVALLEPILRQIVAKIRGTRPEEIQITLVGHHCMCMQIFQEGALAKEIPYYLKIEDNGLDITESINPDTDLWPRVPAAMPLLSEINQQCVAASAIQIIKAILYDACILAHAPGPEGLPAGCPVRVDADGARIAPPPDLGREKMIGIMYGANRQEGFEPTSDEGLASATENCAQLVESIFNISWKHKTFNLDNMLEAHLEMAEALKRLAETHAREA